MLLIFFLVMVLFGCLVLLVDVFVKDLIDNVIEVFGGREVLSGLLGVIYEYLEFV